MAMSLHRPIVVGAALRPHCASGACAHDSFAECDAVADEVVLCAECLRIAVAACPVTTAVVYAPALWPCPTALEATGGPPADAA